MIFSSPSADVFVPDGSSLATALTRTTHLCLAAHQDDIEIMAYPGVVAGYESRNHYFTGVIVTDGAGSSRAGKFANFTNDEMMVVRRKEQRTAARIGKFSAVVQLAHPSAVVKNPAAVGVRNDLLAILTAANAHTVYLHNPADKHDTHVAVFLRSLEALRALPAAQRPQRVYGCEGWRNLDWLLDTDKQVLDASAHPALAAELVAVFQSQIAGGKRYDLATTGRRLANATFHTPHATDQFSALTWAMDLTPLVQDEHLSVEAYTLGYLDRLRADVAARLKKFTA